jgi:hypothetical protein
MDSPGTTVMKLTQFAGHINMAFPAMRRRCAGNDIWEEIS